MRLGRLALQTAAGCALLRRRLPRSARARCSRVPFVSCLLSGLDYTLAAQGERQGNLEAARRCAGEAGLDADALQQCADGAACV